MAELAFVLREDRSPEKNRILLEGNSCFPMSPRNDDSKNKIKSNVSKND